MNWYKSSQLNEMLTSSYYDSDEEDDKMIAFLTQRYKRVNTFLQRDDIDKQLRIKLKAVRNWLAYEIQSIYKTLKTERESRV